MAKIRTVNLAINMLPGLFGYRPITYHVADQHLSQCSACDTDLQCIHCQKLVQEAHAVKTLLLQFHTTLNDNLKVITLATPYKQLQT